MRTKDEAEELADTLLESLLDYPRANFEKELVDPTFTEEHVDGISLYIIRIVNKEGDHNSKGMITVIVECEYECQQ